MTGIERVGNVVVYGGLALAATGMIAGQISRKGDDAQGPDKSPAERIGNYALAVGTGAATGGWVGGLAGLAITRNFGWGMIGGAIAGGLLGAAIIHANQR